MANKLDFLARSTEGEFLAIGEKLQDFYARTTELSEACSVVAAHLSGKELETVIEGFGKVIEAVNRLENGSKRNTDYLRTVLEKLDSLEDVAEGFQKTILLLRVLCVSIRIESARLGDMDHGFETLAEEVHKLSLEIETRSSNVHASCQSLRLMIEQTLSRVLGLEAARQKQAGIVLTKTLSGLEALRGKHSQSAGAAQQISARFETVSNRIGDIVQSMQFHDITRQRIEHAREALVQLDTNKKGFATEGDLHTGRQARLKALWDALLSLARKNHRDLHLVGDIAALQAIQLKNAGNQLQSAVNNILENLYTLAGLVEEMTRETTRLAGADNDRGSSFLEEIKTGFSTVISALGTYDESDRELSFALSAVADQFGEIASQAASIESMGAKIKLISLNAIVKACHAGSQGATLAVLAESTHQLSVETYRLTEMTSEALRSTILASDSLRAAVGTDQSDENRPAALCEGLENQIETLERLNQDIFSTFIKVNAEGSALAGDIRRAVTEVGVHQKVHDGLSEIAAKLEEIVAFARSKATSGDQAKAQERLEELKAGYTMQAERNVHDTLAQAKTDGKPGLENAPGLEAGDNTAANQTQGTSEEDLGDNVELF
ncbi:MAG: hypothetical protein ACP5IL_15795 [Syntrophobacteraceae bacterium]